MTSRRKRRCLCNRNFVAAGSHDGRTSGTRVDEAGSVQPADPTSELKVGPLTGFSVGVTAARRRHEFGAALERRGAAVVYGPAIRIVAVEDDEALRQATLICLAQPPDVVVATTGIGFRGWVDAQRSVQLLWGEGDRAHVVGARQ